jgi:hypothetical protein
MLTLARCGCPSLCLAVVGCLGAFFLFVFLLCQSAFFNFQSLLTVVLLLICLCTYIHTYAPTWLDAHKKGSVVATAAEEIKATEQQQPRARLGCAPARGG